MKTKEKQEDLLAKIIRDIKTPTNAQITALELFLSSACKKINQEEKDLIKLTLNSCVNLQKLIENFHCVHKLNFENLKLKYENFDVIEVINNVLKEFDILIKYSELEVIFNKSREFIIFADKIQIQKAIENILSNSINNAYKNSKIEILISKEKNEFVLKIKNKSPFINQEDLKKIFEKFNANTSSYNKTNLNLGLYLSKEIINAHFGKIIAQSFAQNINILGFSIPLK